MEIELLFRLMHGFEAIKLLRHIGAYLRLRYHINLQVIQMLGGSEDYYPEGCDEDRFNQILLMGDGFYLAATGMRESQSWQRFRQTPEAFRCIVAVHRTTGKKRLAGYYTMYPLTKKATEAILDHAIEGSRHLREEDICRTFSKSSSLYVSAVYGTDRFAQIATSHWLETAILDKKDRKSRLRYVFTRPTTSAGCAIFKRLTGRDPELGTIETIDLDCDDLRIRKDYMRQVKRLQNIGRRRR